MSTGAQSFGSDKDGVAGTRITADVGGGWMPKIYDMVEQ